MSTAAVYYRSEGAVGVITLNRPDNRNSMTPELLDAFAAASRAARSDANARCVVVTGTGTCFSAGADFHATLQRDGAGSAQDRSYAMYEPFLSLCDLEVPVIGALNGHAVGGGFGLALVCDIRIGAETAKYGANFTRLGLAPGMAISYLLPRLIGHARAHELLLTGRLVDGREAAALAILNRATAGDQVVAHAMAMAQAIAANAPIAVRASKAAIRRGSGITADAIRDAARAEAAAQAQTVASDDCREGIAAWLEKREPVFRGR